MNKVKILIIIVIVIVSIMLLFFDFKIFSSVIIVLATFLFGRIIGNRRIDNKKNKYR